MLRAVADSLKATFQDEDVVCRFGGEEFLAILPGTPTEGAAQRAEEVRAKIEALVVRYVDGNLPRVTISIGVASFPQSGANFQDVMKAADEALYRAKDGGRNQVQTSPKSGDVFASNPVLTVQNSLANSFSRPHRNGAAA